MTLAAGPAMDPELAGPIGSLAMGVVTPRAPTLALRALRWQRDLCRLGVNVPFVLTHDIGLILSHGRDQLTLGPRIPASQLQLDPQLLSAYEEMVRELAASEVARRAGSLKLGDELVVVLLARALSGLEAAAAPRRPSGITLPLKVGLFDNLDRELLPLFRGVARKWELEVLRELLRRRLYVLTLVDALDLDTLELFGLLGGDTLGGSLWQVDLLAVLSAPEANDVVDFSLEILPSVLEAKTRPAAGTHAAFGYAGLARRGSIDGLVLSELAWDADELVRRLLDDEALYYAREQRPDQAGRVHHLLIDASASMRGERATFARGMALASAKKLLLAGEEVSVRFFDARLYEARPARRGVLPVAHVLGFKGERGRNPARVFRQLADHLELLLLRERREPIVYVYTHAALYIPRETVAAVTRHARMACVFMLPSGGALELDYLDLLDNYWVVDHAVLASQRARAEEARMILGSIAGKPTTGDEPVRSDRVAAHAARAQLEQPRGTPAPGEPR